MIIGNGLVANAFKEYEHNDYCLIFASGVSNSSNTDPMAFARERQLLEKMINVHTEEIFVYFSTCCIYDASRQNSPYARHKLEMETLVQQHSNYHIFRISNLAGITNNPHTFLNFFLQHILSEQHFYLWKSAYRNIIDIDDAVAVCDHIIKEQLFKNEIVNIANPVNYPVTQIIEELEMVIQKKGKYELIDKGSNPAIDTQIVQQLFYQLNIHFDENYLRKVLQKYF